jgi:hypothetical protein
MLTERLSTNPQLLACCISGTVDCRPVAFRRGVRLLGTGNPGAFVPCYCREDGTPDLRRKARVRHLIEWWFHVASPCMSQSVLGYEDERR